MVYKSLYRLWPFFTHLLAVNEQETNSVVTIDSIERCDGACGLFLCLFAFDWCCGVGFKSGMTREKGVTFLSSGLRVRIVMSLACVVGKDAATIA
jgi:hypothetical protein